VADFWHAVTTNALCNLHIQIHYGRNTHHVAEGVFKSAARALRMAAESDARMGGIPSTKGTL
jgi:imidazoleglycerol-phosphate dehydratase